MRQAGGRGSLFALGVRRPLLADDVFVAPGAMLIGDVTVEAGASIWFNAVARADTSPIRIGAGTNIQDGAVVHVDADAPARIGAEVLIGHLAVVHGCTIHDRGFVGMGAVVLSHATIESDAMLAAGALLPGGKTVGARQLWAGRPARYVRDLSAQEIAGMRDGVRHYREKAALFREQLVAI